MAVCFYVAQLNPLVGAVTQNANAIKQAYLRACKHKTDLLITPECALSGYQTEDLTRRSGFLSALDREIAALTELTRNSKTGILLGTPYREGERVYNAVLHLNNGEIRAVIKKNKLPNYGVFDDPRVFDAGSEYRTVTVGAQKFGVLICEDMWFPEGARRLKIQEASGLICLNASPFSVKKPQARLATARDRITETGLPFLCVFQVGGQDEIVYDGGSFALDQTGAQSFQAAYFEEKEYTVSFADQKFTSDQSENPPNFEDKNTILDFTYRALTLGLRDYAKKNGFQKAVLGVSGGADSALVTAIAADALGADQVHALILPSQYTSELSLIDAEDLLKNAGVTHYHTVSIENGYQSVTQSLAPIFRDTKQDVTEENIQSRLRAILLNAYSNKFGCLLLSTGNKSETAVGYTTLYGDMCGGFNPVKDIYKTSVYDLCRYRNRVRPQGCLGAKNGIFNESVLNKAPTAELRDNQKDSDSLPEYPVLDAILYGLIEEEKTGTEMIAQGFLPEDIKKIRNLLFLSEYKRRQAPPGVKITEKAFGRERRYPISNGFRFEGD